MRKHFEAAALTAALLLASGEQSRAQVMPDMVSRTALRVCSDPSNLPFSNRKQGGFENKIAEIVASDLKKPVRYFWAPSGPGFVRNTLGSGLCDVIMGYTIGAEMVLSTNPYYRSTYVIVAPQGSDLNGIVSLDDPKLMGRHLGVFAATPPVDVLLKKGLINQATVYPLIVDHRFDSPLEKLIDDLKAKRIDAAIVWGPLIGEAVKTSDGALAMTPLLKDVERQDFSYRIGFGIRHDEPDWKHKLEAVIRTRAADIDRVLDEYNIPRLDNAGHLIPPGTVTAKAPLAPGSERHGRSPVPSAGFKMPGPAPESAPPAASR